MLRQRKLWYPLAVGLLLMVTALSACGPTASTTNNSRPETGRQQSSMVCRKKRIASCLHSQPKPSQLSLMRQSGHRWSIRPISSNFAPGLLKEVPTTSNGGIVVTGDTETFNLHLRPNLKWSDGQPLTSADVAFAIKIYSDPTYGDKQGFPAKDIASVDYA